MPTSKGTQTRSTIIDAALALFEERGFEATTMRAIAERAGVSVGNAYYYFASKEHLIQAFYDRVAEQHLTVSEERLSGKRQFADRLYAHIDSWFDLMQPYQPFAATFFRNAADPASPLSPFSAASTPAREAAIGRFRKVIEGSDLQLDDALAGELPELLWLYHMGLILFWVHDSTPGQIASRLAVARTVPLVARAIGLAGVPELRGLIDDVTSLLAEARAMMPAATEHAE